MSNKEWHILRRHRLFALSARAPAHEKFGGVEVQHGLEKNGGGQGDIVRRAAAIPVARGSVAGGRVGLMVSVAVSTDNSSLPTSSAPIISVNG